MGTSVGDSGYSNWARVTPSGEMSPIFPGGVELETGTGTSREGRRVAWRSRTGELSATLEGHETTFGGSLVWRYAVLRVGEHPGNIADLSIYSVGPGGAGVVESQIVARISEGANLQTRRIIDRLGRSDFVRAAAVADVKLNHGTAALSIDGSGSGTVIVAHGLGRAPVSVSMSGRAGGSLQWGVASIGRTWWDADFVQFGAQMMPGVAATGTYHFDWIAIG